jgi:DNA-binding transcriptional regulator YhcF (GntR family)
MIIRIDPHSEIAVYRQIVDAMRVALVNGELAPGACLPPVRRLALDLGTHFNTVAQAYRELGREGWLDIGARSGARVIERRAAAAPKSKADTSFRRRIEEIIAQMQANGVTRARLARELRLIAETLEGT